MTNHIINDKNHGGQIAKNIAILMMASMGIKNNNWTLKINPVSQGPGLHSNSERSRT